MSITTRSLAVVCAIASAAAATLVAQRSQSPVPARVVGIVVGVPRAEASAERVSRTLGPGWRTEPVSADGTIVVFRRESSSPAEAGGRPPELDLVESWEKAHQLVREGATFAELDLEADVPQGEPELPLNVCPPCPLQPVKGYKRGSKPIQGALADPEWSLKENVGANIEGAWKLLTNPATDAGRGVVIAHPDTGYTEHPEFYSSRSGDQNVFPDEGWNYLDEVGSTLDPLLSGLLRNPGHGTKTGSVIVSRRGSQFTPQAPRWVSGVAPGAHLIPLRVTEGVVLGPNDLGGLRISSIRLARAIFDAAAGRRPSGAMPKADVISISLGGLPSTTLKAALDFAASRNVIVVAAAGNQIRRVVFPGGYSNVLGVAGSNFDSKPWKGSSRGSRVKITAPGESVWVAASQPAQLCLQAGDGTSFATATTAGIAALWLSYHRQLNTPSIVNPQPGEIPAAFHRAVSAGFRAVNGWDATRYGPGIIDARAVMTAGVSRRSESEAAPIERRYCEGGSGSAEIDALSGVLNDTDAGPARASTLLGVPDPCTAATAATELVTLYSLNSDVAEAVDALGDSRSPGAREYRRVRQAILRMPISSTLRQLMTGANR